MEYIYVEEGGEDYPSCPLRSDLNTCKATKGSAINSCPLLADDVWKLPDQCPLRGAGVTIKLQSRFVAPKEGADVER